MDMEAVESPKENTTERSREPSIDDALESVSHDRFWLVHLIAFVFHLVLAGQLTVPSSK